MAMDLRINDRVEMKKAHPCGARLWRVTRVGMDVKFLCAGCGREVELPRARAERGVKRIIREDEA